jgi:WD40 repeat protein
VRMMDDKTSETMKILHGHSGPIYAASFSPDRSLLLSSSEDASSKHLKKGNICLKWNHKHFNFNHKQFVCGVFRRGLASWSTRVTSTPFGTSDSLLTATISHLPVMIAPPVSGQPITTSRFAFLLDTFPTLM